MADQKMKATSKQASIRLISAFLDECAEDVGGGCFKKSPIWKVFPKRIKIGKQPFCLGLAVQNQRNWRDAEGLLEGLAKQGPTYSDIDHGRRSSRCHAFQFLTDLPPAFEVK